MEPAQTLMRGLPRKAKAEDVFNFLKPISPVYVNFLKRHSGNCLVVFGTNEEAREAVKKRYNQMEGRYIELLVLSDISR
ncbi:hypothetical protein DPMN_024149 [Dreissena polymorpha]|uniref:RRM domain-containing protein n=1 Tax=Dreissena polymorpha TaxID=45954 RepID=A0A9D4LP81_DREPO|nr:hypothetical protein DPMN_024149 [Dreissena polymorpha]